MERFWGHYGSVKQKGTIEEELDALHAIFRVAMPATLMRNVAMDGSVLSELADIIANEQILDVIEDN